MRINKDGYLYKTFDKKEEHIHTVKIVTDLTGIVNIGRVILSRIYIGKKVRFKVEIVDEKIHD